MVVGMHRSGTSALAGTLALRGACPPEDPIKATAHNEKGHFESLAVVRVTKQMHRDLDTCWYDLRPVDLEKRGQTLGAQFRQNLCGAIQTSFGNASTLLLKDPRISRFVPLACAVLEDIGAAPYIIVCIRNPLEVAKSLETRNGMSIQHGCNLWLRYMLDAEFGSRGFPRTFVNYTEFLSDWRGTLSRFERQLDVTIASGADEPGKVDAFLDGALHHEHSTIDDLRQRFGETSWVYRCYAALGRLVDSPDDEDAMRSLDDIRTAFTEASLSFGQSIQDYFMELTDVRKALSKKQRARKKRIEGSKNPEAKPRDAENEARELQDQLSAIYSSSSWRLTAPLRRAVTLLRRLGPSKAR